MLTSPLLPEINGHIAGRWVAPDSGRRFDVVNPATGGKLAEAPAMGAGETARAVEAAAKAVGNVPRVEQRSAWLSAIADALIANKNELGRIITLENGKPIKEAVGEAEYAAAFYRHFATQLGELRPHELPQRLRGAKWTVHKRPAGVAGLITPWNFPLAMMAKKIAPALGAGCAVVLKPAEATPLSAIAFWHLAHAAAPAGMDVAGRLNLVIGEPAPIGEVLCTHPAVRVISFTGSTEVGCLLISKTAPHVKRLAMELGGNAPFIVFDDADLDAAAEGLLANKFRAGGQTCVCTNRVYVQAGVAEAFTQKVAERVKGLKVGNGLEPDTDIGPLINREGFDKVARHVRDALSRGARRAVGSDPPRPAADHGAFYPPTLLTHVTREMLVCREETFGPVIAIGQFDSEENVVAQANGTPFGLAAYLYTADPGRAARVTAQLHFGHVGVNTGTGPTPEAPFGGMKQSGFGREGGAEGLLEYCETQVVAEA